MRIFHSCWLLAGRLANHKFYSTLTKEAALPNIGNELTKSIRCGSDEDIVKAGVSFGSMLEAGDVLLLSGIAVDFGF